MFVAVTAPVTPKVVPTVKAPVTPALANVAAPEVDRVVKCPAAGVPPPITELSIVTPAIVPDVIAATAPVNVEVPNVEPSHV